MLFDLVDFLEIADQPLAEPLAEEPIQIIDALLFRTVDGFKNRLCGTDEFARMLATSSLHTPDYKLPANCDRILWTFSICIW